MKMKIRIVSPAKKIEKSAIDYAVSWLTNNGFEVELGEHALGQYNYFSGTESQRLSDFQNALDDPIVDVILCARGGYGSIHLIDQLDFTSFVKKPKLIIGYSDITVFHNHIPHHLGIPTVHATAPLNFSENTPEALQSLVNVINGVSNTYHLKPNALNVKGQVVAPVIGGNLAILYALIGTDSDADYSGKILFIEEIGEAVYAVDRMMYALKKSGKLNQISGMIVGGMTSMKDSEIPYGNSVEDLISTHIQSYNIPLCFDFPAGHIPDNRAVVIGKEARLSVSDHEVVFIQ